MNKKGAFTLFVIFAIVAVALLINIVNSVKRIRYVRNIEAVETSAAIGETISSNIVEETTSKSPEEGDYIDSNVDRVLDTLLSQIRSNEFLMTYVGTESIKSESNLHGGYNVYLSGLKDIGYYQDRIELYSIYGDGTYEEYPDIVDLTRYVENVLVQHELAEIDESIFDEVNLSSKIPDGVEQIKKELALYLEDTEEVYESYILEDIDVASFTLSGISMGVTNKLLKCQILYNDKMYLLITRLR